MDIQFHRSFQDDYQNPQTVVESNSRYVKQTPGLAQVYTAVLTLRDRPCHRCLHSDHRSSTTEAIVL